MINQPKIIGVLLTIVGIIATGKSLIDLDGFLRADHFTMIITLPLAIICLYIGFFKMPPEKTEEQIAEEESQL